MDLGTFPELGTSASRDVPHTQNSHRYFYVYNHGRPTIITAAQYHHPPPPPTNPTHQTTRHRMQIHVVQWFFIWRPGWINIGPAPLLRRCSTAGWHQLHVVFDQRQTRRPTRLVTQQFTSFIAILASRCVIRVFVSPWSWSDDEHVNTMRVLSLRATRLKWNYLHSRSCINSNILNQTNNNRGLLGDLLSIGWSISVSTIWWSVHQQSSTNARNNQSAKEEDTSTAG